VVVPALAAVTAVLAAAAAGGAVLGLVMLGAGDTEGWESLGAFVEGLVVGAGLFVAICLGGLVLAARRTLPVGRRTLPVVASIVVPVLLVVASGSLPELTGHSGWGPTHGVAFVAAVATPPAAFAWAASGRQVRVLGAGVGVAVVAVVATAGVGVLVDRRAEAQAARALPLVVFDDGHVDSPFPGWELDRFSLTRVRPTAAPFAHGQEASLKYFTPYGVVMMSMHAKVDPCRSGSGNACRELGTTTGGDLREYSTDGGSGGRDRESAEVVVLAYPDGSGVSLTVSGRRDPAAGMSPDPATVLSHLRRVDRRTFERATGAPLRVTG
jgi:hypothetical protein